MILLVLRHRDFLRATRVVLRRWVPDCSFTVEKEPAIPILASFWTLTLFCSESPRNP